MSARPEVASPTSALKRPAESDTIAANGSPKTSDEVDNATAKRVRLEDVPSPLPMTDKAATVSASASSTTESSTRGDDDSNAGDAKAPADELSEPEDQHDDEIAERLDSEEINLDDSDDDNLFRKIIAAATAQGIPLEYLAQQGIHIDLDDDEPVEYKFDRPPTSLDDVAEFIQSDKCKRILCLAGAGMSVASGIPDFRSSNGLYATLDASTLTATEEEREQIEDDPSFSLDQHLFLENPLPCLEVNREFILGVKERKWKATLAHRFVERLRTKLNDGKGKLKRIYTQNIDGLEDQCEGITHGRRIAVHGSMDEAHCAVCNAPMEFEKFCTKVRTQIKDITGRDPTAPKESTPIRCESCGRNTVKPTIVLFRSRLPQIFFDKVMDDVEKIDLLIILGTSLAVAPANSIVWRVPKSAMRVLINNQSVGWQVGLDCDRNDRDYLARGNCETVVLDLMEKLGWLEDLRPLLEQNELPASSAALLKDRLENPTKEDAEDGDLKPAAAAKGPPKDEDRKPAAASQS